jgi:hypothetical protein
MVYNAEIVSKENSVTYLLLIEISSCPPSIFLTLSKYSSA